MHFISIRCCALLSLLCTATTIAAHEIVAVPKTTAEICSQLGEIAYWAATETFSNNDKRNLNNAILQAGKPNKLRPVIPNSLIDAARKLGVSSHGNAGPGNANLVAARADAIATAMLTYTMCLDGRLSR